MSAEGGPDPYSAQLVLAQSVPELLREFNTAGVLAASDVHLASRLTALAAEPDELVALAVALAGRAPRVGHVSVDLATVRASAVVADQDADLDVLPWPDPGAWTARVAASGLVTAHPDPADGEDRPLHLDGTLLYLDRYWRDELAVARDLLDRSAAAPEGRPDAAAADDRWLEARLEELFPGPAAADQRAAAASAASGRLTVIAGGPGTGKTTTVARVLALLLEQAGRQGARPPLIALAAPTGKAAARMEEAVRAEAAALPVEPEVRAHLDAVSGLTLHRLLGSRPDMSRFRYHRGHRLPHDVVVVDEASMVSLALMARLLEAVRPAARLIVVGDPEQLVSVEAGAVLADVVGPAQDPALPAGGGPGRAAGRGAAPPAGLAGRIAILRTNHRFSGPLAELAAAVRAGDADRTVAVLRAGAPSVRWMAVDWSPDAAPDGPVGPGDLQSHLVEWSAALVSAARRGDRGAALEALRRHRLLCAHRDGPAGVQAWNDRIEEWLAATLPGAGAGGPWYAGRPVMVTTNDYGLRLFNGDTGVVVATTADGGLADDRSPLRDRLGVAFAGPGASFRMVSPYRLPPVETVFATTVHKSQGSEFDRVTLILPAQGSRLLTRELLYTAVTRARQDVLVVGGEAEVRRAVEHPLARASGLGRRLWDQ